MQPSLARHLLITCSLISAIVLVPISAFSQVTEDATVIRSASSTLIEKLLEAAELDHSPIKHNVYSFKVRGYKAIVFVKDDDIQLYAGFSGKKVSLNRINDWNKGKRFSRAYLDDDGDAVLEADLDFEGGVTAETIIRFFGLFAQSVEAFSDHLE